MSIAREIAEHKDSTYIEKLIMALTHEGMKSKKCVSQEKPTVIGFTDNSYLIFNVNGDVHLASKDNGILKIIK